MRFVQGTARKGYADRALPQSGSGTLGRALHPASPHYLPEVVSSQQDRKRRETMVDWLDDVRQRAVAMGPSVAILAFSFASSVGGEGPGTVIRLGESELMDVPSRVDWHTQKGQGWYVKEHYHAADFAFLVCDEQSVGAKAASDLGRAIPAGTWRVFVRHVKNRQGGDNVLGIELGNAVRGDFVSAGSGELTWATKDQPSDYRWAEVAIKTERACRQLRITAKQVTRHGIGDLPEHPLRVILVDSLVVTDREDTRIDPGRRGSRRNLLLIPGQEPAAPRGPSPPKERSHVWLAPDPEGPSRVSLVTGDETVPRPGEGKVTEGNQVRGGGFDAVLQPHWFLLQPESGHFTSRAMLDDSDPAQGPSCLRLKGYSGPYSPKPKFLATLVSAPFELTPGEYACSFVVRADDPQARLGVKIVSYVPDVTRFGRGNPELLARLASVPLGKEWAPASMSLSVAKSAGVQVVFSASGFAGTPDENWLSKGAIWLDGVSVAPGKTVEFTPPRPAEVGVFSAANRLFYPGPLDFKLRAVAYGGQKSLTVDYQVLDLEWQEIQRGEVRVALGDRLVAETDLTIPFARRRGAYLLRTAIRGVAGSSQVLDFSVVDDPGKNAAPPNLGLYCSFAADPMAYFRRAGAACTITNCDRPFRGYCAIPGGPPSGKPPETGEAVLAELERAQYVWYDDVVRAYFRAGVEVIPQLMARQMPKWAQGSPKAFGRYVGAMVDHYRKLGIRKWSTGDEVRLDYRPYQQEAVKAIRSRDPEAKIMISTCPGVVEAWTEELGHTPSDFIGGSYWNASKWHYHAKRAASLHLKRPFWNVGVGWGSRPSYVYDPHCIRMNMGRGRFGVVTNVLFCQAIAEPQLLLTYTNRFTNGLAFGTNDMYTGTFVPHGAYFTAAAGFVRGARAGGEIELKKASDLDAFYMARNGRTLAVISQSQAFWGTLRGESAFRLTIGADPQKLGFFDINLSEVKAPPGTGNGFGWDLPVLGALILEDRGLGKEALLDAVANLTAAKTHGARHVILARPDGGLDLGLWLRNGLSRTLSGTVAIGKRVALAEDTPRERALTLAEGEAALLRFGLSPKMGVSRPIGNLITSFTCSDNRTFAVGEKAHLWAACAKRWAGDITLGGPAGWRASDLVGYVFASGRLGGGYGTEQVRKGGTWFISARERRMGLRVFARWTEERMQFGLDLDNPMRRTAQRIETMFDPGLADMLAGRAPSTRPRAVVLQLSPPAARVIELGPAGEAGKSVGEVDGAALKIWPTETGSFVEAVFPTEAVLGRTPRAGESIGFNLLVEGTNPFTKEQLQMVYSGRPNYLPHDPEGWAQLLFLK